jgi:uncharacterized protein
MMWTMSADIPVAANSRGSGATSALLTGASGAIGGAVARELAARGVQLAISGRNVEKLKSLAKQIETTAGTTPAVLPADLGHRGNAARLADEATAALGRVDAVVNNAGVVLDGLLWVAGDGDEVRQLFETNFWSPVALVAALAPAMIERGSGTIVNVGSIAGGSAIARIGHYSSSRGALTLVTGVMNKELGPRGIRVVEVVLGPIDTPSRRVSGMQTSPSRRSKIARNGPPLGTIELAAKAIADAVTGDARGSTFYPRSMALSRMIPQLSKFFGSDPTADALRDLTVRFGGPEGSESPAE